MTYKELAQKILDEFTPEQQNGTACVYNFAADEFFDISGFGEQKDDDVLCDKEKFAVMTDEFPPYYRGPKT